MSFLKFWGKKSRAKDELDSRKEETDAEAEKRKLRHKLSISRSGRYKQKKWERGGILDRPELYGGEPAEGYKDYQEHVETSSTTSTSSSSSNSRPPPPSSTSPAPNYPHHHPDNNSRRPGHSMAT